MEVKICAMRVLYLEEDTLCFKLSDNSYRICSCFLFLQHAVKSSFTVKVKTGAAYSLHFMLLGFHAKITFGYSKAV